MAFKKSSRSLRRISIALLLKRNMTSSVSSDGNTSCGDTVWTANVYLRRLTSTSTQIPFNESIRKMTFSDIFSSIIYRRPGPVILTLIKTLFGLHYRLARRGLQWESYSALYISNIADLRWMPTLNGFNNKMTGNLTHFYRRMKDF